MDFEYQEFGTRNARCGIHGPGVLVVKEGGFMLLGRAVGAGPRYWSCFLSHY